MRCFLRKCKYLKTARSIVSDRRNLDTLSVQEDPRDKQYYDYMLSYSPYGNVTAQAYPNLLVITDLHDSPVQYWEPAKWVARLRATKTDDNRLLLKTNMDTSSHSGASGRYKRYREIAFQYAFLLDLAGLTSMEIQVPLQ